MDVVRVTRGPLQVTVDEDGKTRVKERYIVSAPLTGQLTRIELEAGDVIEAGKTVLATIQPTDPALVQPSSGFQQQPIQTHTANLTAIPVPPANSALADAPVPLNGLAADIALRAAGGNSRFEIRLDPAELGRQHITVLGKHSGSHAVMAAYESLGLPLSTEGARVLLDSIRAHVLATKQTPTPDDLRRFYLDALQPANALLAA